MTKKKKGRPPLHQLLVLNRWMLGHFQGDGMAHLQKKLAGEHISLQESLDGQTPFYRVLAPEIIAPSRIDAESFLKYDRELLAAWDKLMKKRSVQVGTVLPMKYFQYLPLLFTEIYLDWYFNQRENLRSELNKELEKVQKEMPEVKLKEYGVDDLNKLAFWSATGSGKTLLMHANISQYLRYYGAAAGRPYPDKVILLTPNEGLSRQHLNEFRTSGIEARKFNKDRLLHQQDSIVEVIEITKLAEKEGEKTVAVTSLEGNNLVFVDEGHRGASKADGEWMSRRAIVTKGGFVFEYSATFSQSVAQGSTIEEATNKILKARARKEFAKGYESLANDEKARIELSAIEQEQVKIQAVREAYAKSIIFDYSYRHFYSDGFGKEPMISNLNEKEYKQKGELYFTACLLSFYQQLRLWDEQQLMVQEFNIEKPLWIFVGNTVSGEVSDVLTILNKLNKFLTKGTKVAQWISDLIDDKSKLLDNKGKNIFQGKFRPLEGQNAEDIYADIIERLFNGSVGQKLKVVRLGKAPGEFVLYLDRATPFGLINVGDGSSLHNHVKKIQGIVREENIFGSSQFETINEPNSPIKLLIGAKKFIEGWSSWRVSTMGLLNMGKGEGSQIIQLFGRGVRLKGRDFSLKRTPVEQRPKGSHLGFLETLNIFGVQANYMAVFKKYLKDRDFLEDDVIQLDFKTQQNKLHKSHLKTLKLKQKYQEYEELGFRNAVFPTLCEIPQNLKGRIRMPHALLDLYPKLSWLDHSDNEPRSVKDERNEGKISKAAIECFDWNFVYSAVQQHKIERHYNNLRIDAEILMKFCKNDDSWYTLLMPQEDFDANSYGKIKQQEHILIKLLTIYTSRFYSALKNAYEGMHFETAPVIADSNAMIGMYVFEIDNNEAGQECHKRLQTLRSLVAEGEIGKLSDWNDPHVVAISFSRHLYYPLMSLEDGAPLRMRPLAFDAESEIKFVRALENFYTSPAGMERLKGKSLYLLRNSDSKDKGIGFSLAGNFYPDFLLWLVDSSGKQWLTFIDPKGILKMDLNDPKFMLYQEIKRLEKNIGDSKLVLNSFILSITEFERLINVSESKKELEDKHVLFMEDGGDVYLSKLIDMILADEQPS